MGLDVHMAAILADRGADTRMVRRRSFDEASLNSPQNNTLSEEQDTQRSHLQCTFLFPNGSTQAPKSSCAMRAVKGVEYCAIHQGIVGKLYKEGTAINMHPDAKAITLS